MDKHEEARTLALEALTTAPAVAMLHDPIEYLFAEHFRQRTLCTVLDQLAESASLDRPLLDAALAFLRSEFGPHVQDEEIDLFPLLRRRAEPEDEIREALQQLSEEHASDRVDANQIIGLLEALAQNDKTELDQQAKQLLKRFAANERQHLIVENAIVLPLARARLTEEDKQELGRRMAARRGIDL